MEGEGYENIVSLLAGMYSKRRRRRRSMAGGAASNVQGEREGIPCVTAAALEKNSK